MTADHILRDLSRKVAEDTSSRLRMTGALLDSHNERMMLAISAAGTAIGLAAGFSDLVLRDQGEVLPPEKQVDLMWSILRPIALCTLGGDDADFRELLSHCRDYPEQPPCQ